MSILQQIITIILKYANPERIYLYGSHASGEATESSDLDIAFDDKNCTNSSVIEQEISELNTLGKIDIKNMASAEERFRNRVISTGKVIYSASKKLRTEDGLYNFGRALERLKDIKSKADLFGSQGLNDAYLDVIVKRFEFTFEMSWKAIKRYLDFTGILCNNPRSCFKEAFTQGLLSDEKIWLEMIEQRNLSSHIYSEYEIAGILQRIDLYTEAFTRLHDALAERLRSEV